MIEMILYGLGIIGGGALIYKKVSDKPADQNTLLLTYQDHEPSYSYLDWGRARFYEYFGDYIYRDRLSDFNVVFDEHDAPDLHINQDGSYYYISE